MKQLCMLIAGVLLAAVVAANTPPEVRITTVDEAGDGAAKELQIAFDYRDADGDELSIDLDASADNGANWDLVTVATVAGDTQVQATDAWQAGVLTWAAGQDWPEGYSDEMKLRLTAHG